MNNIRGARLLLQDAIYDQMNSPVGTLTIITSPHLVGFAGGLEKISP